MKGCLLASPRERSLAASIASSGSSDRVLSATLKPDQQQTFGFLHSECVGLWSERERGQAQQLADGLSYGRSSRLWRMKPVLPH